MLFMKSYVHYKIMVSNINNKRATLNYYIDHIGTTISVGFTWQLSRLGAIRACTSNR